MLFLQMLIKREDFRPRFMLFTSTIILLSYLCHQASILLYLSILSALALFLLEPHYLASKRWSHPALEFFSVSLIMGCLYFVLISVVVWDCALLGILNIGHLELINKYSGAILFCFVLYAKHNTKYHKYAYPYRIVIYIWYGIAMMHIPKIDEVFGLFASIDAFAAFIAFDTATSLFSEWSIRQHQNNNNSGFSNR